MFASLALAVLLQITPVAPLPKGTALPPPGTPEAGPMAAVDRLLAGIAARDASAIRAAVRPEGGTTAAIENADGSRTLRHESWDAFLAGIKPGPERVAEQLTDPAVEVDGDIAMVWSPYRFTIDGTLHHCGTDHFSLVREGGSWRVLDISWTERTMGCDAG